MDGPGPEETDTTQRTPAATEATERVDRLAEQENITRFIERQLRSTQDEVLVTRQRADRLAATLAEILIVFSPVSSYTGIRIGWTTHLPIHPDDYDQWDAVLNDTAHVTPTRQSDRTA